MIDKINYFGYAFQNILYKKLKINKSIEKKRLKYGCHGFVNANESNDRIAKALANEKTYAVARMSYLNMDFINRYICIFYRLFLFRLLLS